MIITTIFFNSSISNTNGQLQLLTTISPRSKRTPSNKFIASCFWNTLHTKTSKSFRVFNNGTRLTSTISLRVPYLSTTIFPILIRSYDYLFCYNYLIIVILSIYIKSSPFKYTTLITTIKFFTISQWSIIITFSSTFSVCKTTTTRTSPFGSSATSSLLDKTPTRSSSSITTIAKPTTTTLYTRP